MALRIAALTPWMFLSGGPVARGRYSQQGLWYSTIADGTNEQQLPAIVEKALKKLPDTAEANRVRRRRVLRSVPASPISDGGPVED